MAPLGRRSGREGRPEGLEGGLAEADGKGFHVIRPVMIPLAQRPRDAGRGVVLADLLDQGVSSVGDPTQRHAAAIDGRAPL
ncbi:hypothetical protein [Roseivivax sp. CAU 1761]